MVSYTFQGVFHRNKHKTHFSVQRISVVFYSELFFLLVKTIVYNPYYYCSLIFWIFLSREVVFRSKRNVFLNEFSIPASGNRLSVQFTQYSFIQKFFPVCGNRKIQFLENNLFPGNRNRFSGLWKPFFSSSLRHSCHCQLYFPSGENVFLNAFWLVEKHFLASGNALLSIFLKFSASDSFFFVQWKRSFQTNLSFQLVETNFFPFLGKAFPVQCKLIFQQILHSGQWKLICG